MGGDYRTMADPLAVRSSIAPFILNLDSFDFCFYNHYILQL